MYFSSSSWSSSLISSSVNAPSLIGIEGGLTNVVWGASVRTADIFKSLTSGAGCTRIIVLRGSGVYMKTGRYANWFTLPFSQLEHPRPPHASCLAFLYDHGILKPLPLVLLWRSPYTDESMISFQSYELLAVERATRTWSLKAIAELWSTTKSGQFKCTPVFIKSPTFFGGDTDMRQFLPPWRFTLSHMILQIDLISSIESESWSL